MKVNYEWVGKVNQIVGAEGEIGQYALELDSLSIGRSIQLEEKKLFYLGKGEYLSYPSSLLSEQVVRLIELLICQAYSQEGSGLNWDAFFQSIVDGKSFPLIIEQDVELGLDPTGTFLPMIVEHSRDLSFPVAQIVESYFVRKVSNGLVHERSYYLIPLIELSLDPNDDEAIEELGRGLSDLLREEGMDEVHIAFAPTVTHAEQWISSFQTGQKTLQAGKAFHADQRVHFAWNMVLELLLSEVPLDQALYYIEQTVGEKYKTSFNHELFVTLQVLLEENLNVSETARKLYIHRNTLLYRIERFKQETGRDIRNGQDGLPCLIALQGLSGKLAKSGKQSLLNLSNWSSALEKIQ